jgi:cytochrome c biogenesis protein CcmG/thiol:disulfide interchange protein DsbE
MRASSAALIGLFASLLVAGSFLFAVTTSIQSRQLVYLFFLAPAVVAFAVGFWRGRQGTWPFWLNLLVINLVVVGLAGYLGVSENAWAVLFIPGLTILVSAAGLLAGRRDPAAQRSPAVAAGALGALGALAVLGAMATVTLTFFLHPIVGSFIVSKTVDQPMPAFDLAMLDGQKVQAQALRGHVVVMDFWTSWCQPCRREFPELEKVYARYRGRPDISFYAVDGDRGDTPENARRFFQEAGYKLPVAYDHGSKIYEMFSAPGFPTLVVLDRQGHLRYRHSGFLGAEDFEGNLTRALDDLLRPS